MLKKDFAPFAERYKKYIKNKSYPEKLPQKEAGTSQNGFVNWTKYF
jgi:hypothetical protein